MRPGCKNGAASLVGFFASASAGHERPSMTQDVYLARSTVNPRIAAALEDGYATQIEK